MNQGIFQHSCFRSFLLAHAEAKKAKTRGWSYRRWAKDLGLENAATLTRIIKGDRAPGPEITEKFVRYFAFSKSQAEFFKHLVRLEKTREDDVRVLILDRLRKLHPERRFQELDHQTFMAISNWYFCPIRESARMKNAPSDPAEIAKALRSKVTPTQVKEAIEILVKLGLLARDSTGKLKYAGGIIDTKPGIATEGAKRYLEQFLDQARSALRETPIEEHSYFGTAVAIRKDKIPEAKKLIHEFKERFIALVAAEEGQGEIIYQFQSQFFPVLKGTDEGEEK